MFLARGTLPWRSRHRRRLVDVTRHRPHWALYAGAAAVAVVLGATATAIALRSGDRGVSAAALGLEPTSSASETSTESVLPVVSDVTPVATVSAAPGTCPTYPGFPSLSCTGWQHTGVTPAACDQLLVDNVFVIKGSEAGTVVDGCDFTGHQVRITGDGAVTLKRSRVRHNGSCDSACAAILIDQGAGPVTIEDVEVTTTDPNVSDEAQRLDRTITVAKNNDLPVTIRRVYAHDATRGIDVTGQSNVTIVDSYLAFNVSPPSNGKCDQERKHSSVIRAAGGVSNLVVRNTVLGVGACAFASGLVALYPENGPNHDITFDGGLWIVRTDNDGAFGVAVGYTPGSEQPNSNITVRNVQISTQYYSEGCPSGCGQNWTGSKAPTGVTVWDNVTRFNPGQIDHGQPIDP